MPDSSFVAVPAIGVRPAQTDETYRLLDCLTLAFAADPAARWIWPDTEQYLETFPKFAKAFGGGALALGTGFVTEDGGGTALWFDPASGPNEDAVNTVLDESIAAPQRDTAFEIFEQMAAFHPVKPHWYLPLIGVEPAKQGQGHGAALMAHTLRVCDASRMPAYLEASSLRSVSFYLTQGFEPIGKIAVGACPPIIPMVRHPV